MKHMWSEEEIQALIPSGGATLEDIVDSQGHKRFIEGNGTNYTITGVTSSYCKWTLSGTHLMLVYALTMDSGTQVNQGQDICQFELPQWILNKIYSASNGLVDRIDSAYMPNEGSPTTKKQELRKNDTILTINNRENIQTTSKTYLRIQFDLIIDAE